MSDSRGGRFYVLSEGAEPIYEDDLTAEQRASLGLPASPAAPVPLTHGSPQATEEVGPDV